jgi:hypothetical protein
MSESEWKSRYLTERVLREEYETRLLIGRTIASVTFAFGCFMCCVLTLLEGLDIIASSL